MSVNVVLRLTRSQQMALVDILIAYIRSDDVQEFIDVANDVTTTPGELLRIVGDVREMEATEIEIPWH
jgi:isopropylmalate/homocitrate/citramalate synthase